MNGDTVDNASTVSFTSLTDESIQVVCFFDIILLSNPPKLYEIISPERRVNLSVEKGRSYKGYLKYLIPTSKKQDVHTYRCATNDTFAEVVLSYGKFLTLRSPGGNKVLYCCVQT